MNNATPQQCREPYFTPKLTIYGTIEKLTKASRSERLDRWRNHSEDPDVRIS